MSKAGFSKFHRRFVEAPGPYNKGKFIKRFDTLPPEPLKTAGCLVCHRSMKVAKGTVAKYHKECRKNRKGIRYLIAR